MKLRPHHVLDIVSDIGAGTRFEPHPYGHSLHTVAEAILAGTDFEAEWVVGADAICAGCKHLQSDGSCVDMMGPAERRHSKQEYNDAHDRRLLAFLRIAPGAKMTVRKYLERVRGKMPEAAIACSHPGEDSMRRLANLERGLTQLGIRSQAQGPVVKR